MKIYKYELSFSDKKIYEIPLHADELSSITASMQGSKPYIWLPTSDYLSDQKVSLWIVGTGHDTPEGYRFVCTLFHGPLVWHVLMKVEEALPWDECIKVDSEDAENEMESLKKRFLSHKKALDYCIGKISDTTQLKRIQDILRGSE